MISFKVFLESLRNPSEIGEFKTRMSPYKEVDSRNQKWKIGLNKAFEKYGFRPVGEGKYGSVFENPKYPFIVKVFMRDTAYLKWLNFAKANPDNPYVPRIKGKVIKVGDLFMAVRLERLTKGGSFDDVYNAADGGNKHASKVVDFIEANSKLMDLHDGNIMKRGSQLVIIDPFYNFYRGGALAIDPNDLSEFKNIL